MTEDTPAGPPLAVISHEWWRARFGGDPNVLGTSHTLGDTAFTIVGVLPAGIAFPERDTAI